MLSHTSTNTTFFPKPPTTFLTCFSRGERLKYAGKKFRLNRVSNSQTPGHESETLTTEPPGRANPRIRLSYKIYSYILAHNIFPEYNPETNVCQGIYCNENGDPISWTKPNCYAPPDKVARGNQAHSGGCFFGDQRLQPGQQVTSGCWNVMCTDSGLVLDGSGCSLDSAPANDGMPAIGRK